MNLSKATARPGKTLHLIVAALIVSLISLFPITTQAQSLFPGLSGSGSNDASADTASEGDQTPLAALLEVLKDEGARAELIEELEKTVAPENDGEGPAKDDSTTQADGEEGMSIVGQIATTTQEFVEGSAATVTALWATLKGGVAGGEGVLSGLSGTELSVLRDALPSLLAVIGITFALFFALRYFARRLYMRMGERAGNVGIFRSIALFIRSNLLDALIVIVAWAAGYVIALYAVGEPGEIGIRQSLYLNAFLLVEMTKVVIRAFLSPVASGLRIVPVSDFAARALNRYLGIIISVLGYGQLLIVPIISQNVNAAAASAVSALLSVIVLLYLVYVVLRRRKDVARWLQDEPDTNLPANAADQAPAQDRQNSIIMRFLRALAGIWHWVVLAYIAAMFLVVMTQPAEVTWDAIVGSGKILAAIIIAALLSGVLARAVHRGISLPQDINEKLPLLEHRINAFVPRAFSALRLILLICVLMFALDVIGMIDMKAWLESKFGLAVTTALVSVGLILTVAFGIWLAVTSFVDYKLNPEYGAVPTSRETTLWGLMRNAATIALIILTLMFVLSEIGLDIGPLLASAGVLGLAIGFGAQKMVQDIITGIFIQFENVINVGDVITVGRTTGTVEKLSVRSVSLRDVQGVFHMIPFSTVDVVSNYMRGFAYTVTDMGIAYRENIEEAKQAMFDAFDRMTENEADIADDIISELEWFGVQSLGDSAVVLRTRMKTKPGKQWGIGRMFNGYLKMVFDERGIEIPFPQQTIWLGENKDGTTQPFKIEGPQKQQTPPSKKTKTKPIKKDDVPDSDDANDAEGGADR
ncbi:Small-conductance mechanosensitive channel [Sulfitobacter marinus]|uniref:Small-conductance mechanosensitive channel n=1 Tax=Sulfitobacter marinus TaxID=394264 RepID=A0A1I6UNX0_9RHOB|nr:mechanosensitive ion channel domain-containing protein [Sulfitobacter marinus]SFT03166.1 Small-conductance mechanosensitive channel [Sulfitobacter marinus]